MLYEVITLDILAVLGGEHHRIDALDLAVAVVGEGDLALRITSYNVCYTKLLRGRTLALGLAQVQEDGLHSVAHLGRQGLAAAGDGVEVDRRHRITSYNVCYTKLLRVKAAVNRAKLRERKTGKYHDAKGLNEEKQ